MRWSERQWRRAQEMRDAGSSPPQIAEAVGLTSTQVRNRFRNKSACDPALARPWPALEWQEAQKLRSQGLSYSEIAAAIGRSRNQVMRKFNNEKQTGRRAQGVFQRPVILSIARDVQHRDLTSFLMGDPVPGRSALDRMEMIRCRG